MKAYLLSTFLLIVFPSFLPIYCTYKSNFHTILRFNDSEFENVFKKFLNNIKPKSNQDRIPTDCLTLKYALWSDNYYPLKEMTLYSILKAHGIFYITNFEIENNSQDTLKPIDRASICSLVYMIKYLGLRVDILTEDERKDLKHLLKDVNLSALCWVKELENTKLMYIELKQEIASINFRVDLPRFPVLKIKNNDLPIKLRTIALKIEKIAQHALFKDIFASISYLQLLCKKKLKGSDISKKWNIFFDSIEQFCKATIPEFEIGASCEIIWQTFGGYLIHYIDLYFEHTIEQYKLRAGQLTAHPKEYSDMYSWYLFDPSIQKNHAHIIKKITSLLDFSKFESIERVTSANIFNDKVNNKL